MNHGALHPDPEGRLVLVVGPSGAGKDSLIEAARQQLPATRFVFPLRIITRRDDSGAEASDYVTLEDFCRRAEVGAFALHWQAHGHHYAIPRSIDDDLAEGRHVVVNVSRAVIEQARGRYPRCLVCMVTASPQVLRQRLLARGREVEGDIDSRLNRALAEMPERDDVVRIPNDGPLPEAVRDFIATLEQLESTSVEEGCSQLPGGDHTA